MAGSGEGRGWRLPAIIGTVLVLVIAAVVTVVSIKVHRDHVREAARRSQAEAEQVVRDFLAAWAKGSPDAMAALATPDTAAYVRTEIPVLAASLQISSATHTVTGPVSSTVRPGVAIASSMVLQGLGTWTSTSYLDLQKVDKHWKVAFAPATIDPRLGASDTVARTRQLGTRGVLTTAAGTPIRGLDREIDGNVLGSVGTYTADQAKAAGAGFETGDRGGVSGLERAYNAQLAGTPGGSLVIKTTTGATKATIISTPVVNGRNVALSFDLHTQAAAESALLNGVAANQIGSLVAVDVASGKVLALANKPVDGYPYASRGSFAPGSTFKIVTTAAALMAGRSASTVLPCEKTATIGGQQFKNAEDESYGPLTLAESFAKSCNTAYVTLAGQLPLGSITTAAELFGMAPDPLSKQAGPLPIASTGGSVPTATSISVQASEAIGQASIAVSPLQMASVAAAIAGGTWHQPYLTAAVPADEKTNAIPAVVSSNLRDFMGLVVTEGTAKNSGLPAGTHGKTGTAEYGYKLPLPTIAWFVGYRNGIAFACQVGGAGVDAGFGADTAAPVVASFLDRL